MNLIDTKEWFLIADDDFDAGLVLNKEYKKKLEIICYLCSQAVEKYLKGYIVYNEIVPKKTHDLKYLLDRCIEINDMFKKIKSDIAFLDKYTSDMRYPYRQEITEEITKIVLKTTEKIKGFEIFNKIRNEIKEYDRINKEE